MSDTPIINVDDAPFLDNNLHDEGLDVSHLSGENSYQDENSIEPSSQSEGDPTNEGNAQGEGDLANEGDSNSTIKSSKEASYRQAYEHFIAELEQSQTPEEKLKKAVAFMEEVLSGKQGTPHFKSFWDARNIALQLFKENAAVPMRTELWNKYSELSKEARHLKQMLDEQSSFAAEQIEIAVAAIEQGLESPSSDVSDPNFITALEGSHALHANAGYYAAIQGQLNQLNAFAVRVTALRKELIRTEMRIRQKNKFFQRLSAMGDKIFPARKELIKEISQKFIADIDSFIEQHFNADAMQESLFMLREEIKVLQNIAKAITLNTHAFKHTRMCLSKCWDDLKILDKERKKLRAQQKSIYRQNADPLVAELNEMTKVAESEPVAELQQRLDLLVSNMQSIELGRDEVKFLRDKVSIIRKVLLNRLKEDEHERSSQMQAREQNRKVKVAALKQSIHDLIQQLEQLEAEDLHARKESLSLEIAELPISKMEKQDLERSLKPIKDAIIEKREKSLMDLSEDDRNALQNLKNVLRQRKERRQEIKQQLEQFRKSGVTSGLDLEKAMNFSEQVAAEKERLEKISQSIKEIEEKIAFLERKV